jgi:hypothetical protein
VCSGRWEQAESGADRGWFLLDAIFLKCELAQSGPAHKGAEPKVLTHWLKLPSKDAGVCGLHRPQITARNI